MAVAAGLSMPLPQRVERREHAPAVERRAVHRARRAPRRAPRAADTAPAAATASPATIATPPDAGTGEEVGQLVEAAGHRALGRWWTAGGAAPSPPASSRSIGSEANTGPPGGLSASWKARRRIVPSSSAVRTSWPHFTAPPASSTSGPDRSGSVDDVAVVLLPGGDDERRAVGPGVGEVADGVAEPGRRVEVEERRAAGGLGVAVGHADDGRLLEAEHVVEVVGVGEGVDQRQLGAARVAEHVGDALGAQHLEQHVASEDHDGAPYWRPVDWSGPGPPRPDGPSSTPCSASRPYSCSSSPPGSSSRSSSRWWPSIATGSASTRRPGSRRRQGHRRRPAAPVLQPVGRAARHHRHVARRSASSPSRRSAPPSSRWWSRSSGADRASGHRRSSSALVLATLVTMVVGELVPKSIAIARPAPHGLRPRRRRCS